MRTHAAVIWNTELDEKKTQLPQGPSGSITHQPTQAFQTLSIKPKSNGSIKGSVGRSEIRESQLYKRILDQSLNQVGINPRNAEDSRQASVSNNAQRDHSPQTPHLVPPKSSGGESTAVPDNASQRSIHVAGLSEEDSVNLVRQVAEMAATAAAVAARDATAAPRKTSVSARTAVHHSRHNTAPGTATFHDYDEAAAAPHEESGGHDAPNWGRLKSSIILLGATLLYAVIAEILVNTVDVVLESVDIDEKFLGITLFALVPNTTEFLASPPTSYPTLSLTKKHTERHIFRHERQHRPFHGNRIGLRSASLSASDPRAGLVQRILWRIYGSAGSYQSYLCVSSDMKGIVIGFALTVEQPYFSTVGYGYRHPLRLPA